MTVRTPAELAADSADEKLRAAERLAAEAVKRAERAELDAAGLRHTISGLQAEVAMLRRELAVTKSELRTSAAIQKQLANDALRALEPGRCGSAAHIAEWI